MERVRKCHREGWQVDEGERRGRRWLNPGLHRKNLCLSILSQFNITQIINMLDFESNATDLTSNEMKI